MGYYTLNCLTLLIVHKTTPIQIAALQFSYAKMAPFFQMEKIQKRSSDDVTGMDICGNN